MESSTPSTIQVWTKNDCVYCELAKQVLDEHNAKFEEKIIGVTANRNDLLLILPDAKTVPQIFFDGKNIGGYTELMHLLNTGELKLG